MRKLSGLLIIGKCDQVLCSTQNNPDLGIEKAGKTGGDEEREKNPEEFEDDISDSGSAASETGSGSPLSDFAFKLDDISNIISCLYNLCVAMRQPVPQDRLQKYAAIDLSHYEFYDKQHVLEKFPNGKPRLIERLGNANTQRRQYFKYRLLHHEKIAKGLKHVGPATAGDTSTPLGLDGGATTLPQSTHADPVHHDADPGQGNYVSSQNVTNEDAGTVITAAKTSTTISIIPKSAVVRTQPALDTIEAESDGGQTATSFGTIMEAGNVKLLKVPDPPDADRVFSGNAFQCPYCYFLIIVKNSRAWQYVSMSWMHVAILIVLLGDMCSEIYDLTFAHSIRVRSRIDCSKPAMTGMIMKCDTIDGNGTVRNAPPPSPLVSNSPTTSQKSIHHW